MNKLEAREKAVRFIGISKKTEYEVKCKLKKFGFPEDIIEDTILYLIDLDYINDDEYVNLYIKQCIKEEKHSIMEIKQKLLAKGVDKEKINSGISDLYDLGYEQKVIAKLEKSKLINYDDVKKANYLYRRGFKIND